MRAALLPSQILPPIFPRVENCSAPKMRCGARARASSHQAPRAAGTAARAWDTRRPGSSRGRWRRGSHPVSKCLGGSRERSPCRTQGGHSHQQPGGKARPPTSATQETRVMGRRPRHREKMDSERSTQRAMLRGGRAQRESQVEASTEQTQHPLRTEGRGLAEANKPAPSALPPSPASLPCPHQAARAAVPLGALSPRTQRAVVGRAAGVRALLEPERQGGTR